MPKDTSYRVLLPSDVEPVKYDLTLEPDLERFTFEGVVKIDVKVNVATEVVSVHQKQLVISEAKFTPSEAGAKAMEAEEITLKVKDMTATFGFAEVLPVGDGVLEIKFRGILNDQMAGFYRSKYKDSKGATKYMGVTQFEAIDARRCFPCWDEPAKKAIFTVTMMFPAELTCLSNMPQSRSEVMADGRRKETFMPTPKMSTYLLAFCIGEYEFISGQAKGGTLARVFCPPGSIAKCTYALKCCIRSLDFYNDFFGIDYPLPKLDMIAIPDFSAGAMENWGLVTYREVALLCDEKTVSSTQKQRICSVIAHELAHQWFGNLVTMAWWDDLWLNEGFANWMQTFATDALHPEWKIWESYVSTEQARALNLDALRSSHPIQVPIGKAQEVEEVFDAISYCKGGSVVRMLYAVLGAEDFQKGLRSYFAKHKYGNTETIDLWNAWSEASGKNIPDMMNSWTEKMGYPLLKVIKDPYEQAGDSWDEIEVEQCWFLADGSVEAGDEQKTWVIPVKVLTDQGVDPTTYFFDCSKGKKQTLKVETQRKDSSKFMKLNGGQHVPVRVQYPDSMMTLFAQRLIPVACRETDCKAEDRIGLLSDTYALSKSGALNPIQLVNLLSAFKNEHNDKVWSELASVLGGLDKVIGQGLEESTAAAFTEFAGKLIAPVFAKEVGWEAGANDSDNKKKLRSTLVGLLSKYCTKDQAVVAEAKKRCEAFLQAPNDVSALPADIRPAVLSLTVKTSGDEIFDRFMKAHDDVEDGAVKLHIYQALGESKSAALRGRLLTWCLTDSCRAQDLFYGPMSVATNGKAGADQVFKWVQDDYPRIYERLGTTSMILFNHIARISGAGFVSNEKAAEVEAFWKSKPVYSMLTKAIAQTVEGIKSNARFVERLGQSEAGKAAAWSTAASKLS